MLPEQAEYRAWVSGCYANAGLGSAGGGTATAHLTIGISIPLVERANARVGGNVATGGDQLVGE